MKLFNRITSELRSLNNKKLRVIAAKVILLRILYVPSLIIAIPFLFILVCSEILILIKNALSFTWFFIYWIDNKVNRLYKEAYKINKEK